MPHEPKLSALSFSLAQYRMECTIKEGKLALKVMVDLTQHQTLALAKLAIIGNEIEMEVGFTQMVGRQMIKAKNGSREVEEVLHERLAILQNYVSDLQRKMDGHGNSKKDLRQNGLSQKRLPSLPKENLLPSQEIRERAYQQTSRIVQKSVNHNVKLELLNEILQQKLRKREGDLLELERSLLEREELIKELAQKLINANTEKEDIFNEYEKILQVNVFHKQEKNKQQVAQVQTKPSKPVQKEEQIVEVLNEPQNQQSPTTQKQIQIADSFQGLQIVQQC